MTLGYMIEPYFSNHQRTWFYRFSQCYKLTKKKYSNKKLKEIEEIRLIRQCFHSYFHHMLHTQNCNLFNQNDLRCKYGYLTPHTRYPVEQVTIPILIGLDVTWYTKGSHVHMCIFHKDSGS